MCDSVVQADHVRSQDACVEASVKLPLVSTQRGVGSSAGDVGDVNRVSLLTLTPPATSVYN